MSKSLKISVGQYSDKGCKPVNQDFHATFIPDEPLLGSKGITIALADGISSSDVSQIASETAVKGFIEDYYATSETWTVKTSVYRVLSAINSWLHAQSRHGPHRYDLDRGYVCTFSAVVIKSTTAYLFHVGDSRVCYLAGNRLEPLTDEHRLWAGPDKSYLSRALGMREQLEIDYQSYTVERGDTLVLMTDGIHEHVDATVIAAIIHEHIEEPDLAASRIAEAAMENGSEDNLTIQIVRVDELPPGNLDELNRQASELPFTPELRPRSIIDGYEIIRELHHSHRSHIYLAKHNDTGKKIVLKVPSVDLRGNDSYIEHFLMEEWITQRIDNPHIVKAIAPIAQRSALYIAHEYIEGQTLQQWMHDNPEPSLEDVRGIIEQIAAGLRALHRQEMLHQDLRPANVMIDEHGTVKIIDLGSAKVAGIVEIDHGKAAQEILGTAQYTAPEYFLGEQPDKRSDLFSLGVIAYQMLCGDLPYGADVSRVSSRAKRRQLRYRPVMRANHPVPSWINAALQKAVHPQPDKRYHLLSEFIYDLRHPNPSFENKSSAPLLERNPLLFWKGLSLLLFMIVVLLFFFCCQWPK